MPLALSEKLLSDLNVLGKVHAEAVRDFCGVCLDFFEAGPKKGVFARAASALGLDADAVAGGVMALTELLLDAAKLRSSESELNGALIEAGLPDEHRKVVTEFYAASSRRLRAHLGGVDLDSTPQLRAVDWRLHVTVASRFAHDRMEPGYLFRFDTVVPAGDAAAASAADIGAGAAAAEPAADSSSSLHVSADFAALRRVSEALDEAAAELKSAHAKRVLRYIR